MNHYKSLPVAIMAVLGLAALTTASAAAPQPPVRSTSGFNKQVMSILPRGYQLTQGKNPLLIRRASVVNAANSPLNDPFAPLVNGYNNFNNSNYISGGSYYGPGPVMTGVKHIYYIWYGNWSGNTAPSILVRFAQALGSSKYMNILSTYTNFNGQRMTNLVTLSGQTYDNYSQGTLLTDSGVEAVGANAIHSGQLPMDANGVYFVLTSADVMQGTPYYLGAPASKGYIGYGGYVSGFCNQYCGWHSDGLMMGATDIKYAFVGDGDACQAIVGYNSCYTQTTSPNGNAGADGMASVIAHEFEESATDPVIGYGWNGEDWWGGGGYENGDQCAWRFGVNTGDMFMTLNGGYANMSLGGYDYLIQKNAVIVDPNGYASYGYPNGQNWDAWEDSQNPASETGENFSYTGVGTTNDYCSLHYP